MSAAQPDATAYALGFSPRGHLLHVRMTVAAPATLVMATWTPGSYLIREYARLVVNIRAHREDGGGPLAVVKVAKNRWQVGGAMGSQAASRAVVNYTLYARELSVRTNFVDESFALVVGAATFLRPLGDAGGLPATVSLELPDCYASAHAALPPVLGPTPWTFAAASYEALVDAPILAGTPVVAARAVAGGRTTLVAVGAPEAWDAEAAADDLARIHAAHQRFWQAQASEDFLVLALLDGGTGGGLEHANSLVAAANGARLHGREETLRWLGLLSHELFHAWNVKRLTPRALVAPDLEREAYTSSLWVSEGITSYYDDLQVHRAGLCSEQEYLVLLGKTLSAGLLPAGAGVQSLAEASFDAWIKFYRPGENAANHHSSYYAKGAAVALALDLHLQGLGDGSASLDQVMRLAYARFAGGVGFEEGDFRAVAEEVAGTPLAAFFAAAVDGTEPLPLDDALARVGIRLTAQRRPAPRVAGDRDGGPRWAPFVGLRLAAPAGEAPARVAAVVAEGPAEAAGVAPGDEILALDADHVRAADLGSRLDALAEGAAISLLVARRGTLRRLVLTPGAPQPVELTLAVDPGAAPDANARRRRWLAGAPSSPAALR